MLKTTIKTIPHDTQMYETCGNWFESIDDDQTPTLEVRVSQMNDWRMEALIGVHELVEALLCKHDGVTDDVVTAFDVEHINLDEPGDHPGAPYKRQHCIATAVERLLAAELGVDWLAYTEAVDAL
jgi:hypothetical protein